MGQLGVVCDFSLNSFSCLMFKDVSVVYKVSYPFCGFITITYEAEEAFVFSEAVPSLWK